MQEDVIKLSNYREGCERDGEIFPLLTASESTTAEGFSSNEEQYASNEDVEWKKIVLNFEEYEPRTLLPCRANLMAELHPTSEEGQLAPIAIISISQYSCVDFIISSDLTHCTGLKTQLWLHYDSDCGKIFILRPKFN